METCTGYAVITRGPKYKHNLFCSFIWCVIHTSQCITEYMEIVLHDHSTYQTHWLLLILRSSRPDHTMHLRDYFSYGCL